MGDKTISVELNLEEIMYLMLRVGVNVHDIKNQGYKDDYTDKQLRIGNKLFDELTIKMDELCKK